ncbi:uncharacterized protein [Leptinotarsa decemlineata]|uniref:uncharacterized protein n=1 Tax=Leptinotarsa decemlineata TaxID=7539 RepID=UPI003D30A7CD
MKVINNPAHSPPLLAPPPSHHCSPHPTIAHARPHLTPTTPTSAYTLRSTLLGIQYDKSSHRVQSSYSNLPQHQSNTAVFYSLQQANFEMENYTQEIDNAVASIIPVDVEVERPGSPDMFEGDEVAMVQEVKASTSGGVQRPRSPVSFQEDRLLTKPSGNLQLRLVLFKGIGVNAIGLTLMQVVGRPPKGILRDVPHRSH